MIPKHSIRIIPRLDIKGANLVKGIHLEGLRVLGNPEDYAFEYYRQGADELLIQDVVASLYGRNNILEIVSKTAEQIFIPLTVGGGIRSIRDISAALHAGADKVAINTAALARPLFIKEAAKEFGSSTIVVSIEAIRNESGGFLSYTDNGREYTGVNVVDWARKVEEMGAGEIILTSVDRDGTGVGYDIDLISLVSKIVTIPVVAHGGAGRAQDLVDAVQAGADALCLSSMLHYSIVGRQFPRSLVSEGEGNLTFLIGNRNFSKVDKASVADLRVQLKKNKILCR